MKYQSALARMVPLIAVLVALAAGSGLFYQTPGAPYAYTNHRGETVMINGHGLYRFDTVSTAAQMQGNDLVALAVGLPLLIVASWLAFHGSLRGRLLLVGTLGFVLYTYMSMAMLAAYNALFLVYVALFGLALYAFVLCMMSFDPLELAERFPANFPRRSLAGLLFIVGGFLLVAWLGRIVPPLLNGVAPALDNTTTLVIQAMDLALVVPLALLSGILLLRRNPWGYLLSSVFVMKAITLGLGVCSMVVSMWRAGVPDSLFIAIPFLLITFLNLVSAVLLLRHVAERPVPRAAAT